MLLTMMNCRNLVLRVKEFDKRVASAPPVEVKRNCLITRQENFHRRLEQAQVSAMDVIVRTNYVELLQGYYVDGLSIEQLANKYDRSPRTIQRWLHQARMEVTAMKVDEQAYRSLMADFEDLIINEPDKKRQRELDVIHARLEDMIDDPA